MLALTTVRMLLRAKKWAEATMLSAAAASPICSCS